MMMKALKCYQEILSGKNSQEADLYTIKTQNVSAFQLMERAGKTVCETVLQLIPSSLNPPVSKTPAMIFCGKGNNGGDGLICAHQVWKAGQSALVLLLEEPELLKDDAKKAFFQFTQFIKDKNLTLFNGTIPWIVIQDAKHLSTLLQMHMPSLLIDALYGTGLKGPLCGKSADIINVMNQWRNQCDQTCKILSVDIPSGLSADGNNLAGPHIVADTTVTFFSRKITHASEPNYFFCGEIICKDIGITSPQKELDQQFVFLLPRQYQPAFELKNSIELTTHKGEWAHVGILEGDLQTSGASRLAALAALRAGASLATLLVSNIDLSMPYDRPEFMKRSLQADPHVLLNKLSVLVLGPGLISSQSQEQALSILKLTLREGLPVVLDAGCLFLLDKIKNISSRSVIFATPHPGEAGQLLQESAQAIQNDRMAAIDRLRQLPVSSHLRIIWILKGACPIISERLGNTVICEGGVPCLAIGGSGDVLSGLIAGLTHPQRDAFDTAVLAVSTHLAAGRYLQNRANRGNLASEIADSIPKVLYEIS